MARMSFACILSVLMVTVAACSGGERAATTTTSSATNDHPPRATVALITHQAPGDTFWDLVRRGAEAAAAKDDIDLRYSHDPDAAAQANLVR
jgi:simple sugar transport system substrate-binding protein